MKLTFNLAEKTVHLVGEVNKELLKKRFKDFPDLTEWTFHFGKFFVKGDWLRK